ncbi:unnamed protein product, partial [Ilex paraguariensis]
LEIACFILLQELSCAITIHGNGKSVKAMVVDECDSTMGCDVDHAYQPPCANNIVDASAVVWSALGVPDSEGGGWISSGLNKLGVPSRVINYYEMF